MTSNTMGNGELLVLKDLYVWYTKGKPVLEKFSLELKRNEVVGLIGLNGAGKTTFIKTLSGLLDSFQAETGPDRQGAFASVTVFSFSLSIWRKAACIWLSGRCSMAVWAVRKS